MIALGSGLSAETITFSKTMVQVAVGPGHHFQHLISRAPFSAPFVVLQRSSGSSESQAREARVGLIQAAIASGVYRAGDVYEHLARKLSLADSGTPCRLHLPSAPDRAWMLLEKPVPLAAPGEDVVALNGQTSSMQTLFTLALKLGEKRKRLKLVTRQELIDLVTRTHGRVLVGRAVSELMKAHPDWSAKTGLASWQVYFGAIITGLALGALAFAPRETLTLGSLALSLFFLLAIVLRFAAVVSLLAPATGQKWRLPPLLSERSCRATPCSSPSSKRWRSCRISPKRFETSITRRQNSTLKSYWKPLIRLRSRPLQFLARPSHLLCSARL